MVYLLVAFMAWPALGETVIRCADGSPCPLQSIEVMEHECCPPTSCHEPVKDECFVTTSPAPLRVIPQAAPSVEQPALLAIVPINAILTPPTDTVTTVAAESERPPTTRPPKQGRSPRAPPVRA